ncbi:MAG TPA: hypothetical protein VF605_06790 [Allosphingosinicella sp.]|jgi:hypothetical protein
MPFTVIAAILLAQAQEMGGPEALTSPPATYGPEEDLGDTERLYRLQRDIGAARARGILDETEAKGFNLEIARIRRQIMRMGMQVGVRQRVRVRARIGAVRTRLDARLAANHARSGK